MPSIDSTPRMSDIYR